MIIDEPIGIVLPENHDLAQKNIIKKDLEGCDFLSLSQSDSLTKTINHFCSRSGFKPDITMCVNSPAALHELLEMDFGIAFAPRYTWHSYYNKSLIFKHVEDMPMRRFVHLILNDKKYITREIQCCYNAIGKFYKKYAHKFI